MTSEETRARWICCPLCDKKKCEREADDCDVKIYLKDKAERSDDRIYADSYPPCRYRADIPDFYRK